VRRVTTPHHLFHLLPLPEHGGTPWFVGLGERYSLVSDLVCGGVLFACTVAVGVLFARSG
jgi:hypothetical protein